MYTTSDAYKKNQSAIKREVYYEIEYGQIDINARDTAQLDGLSTVTPFSKPNEIINEKRISSNIIIATLEPDQFLLDGTRTLMGELPLPYEVGAWGDVLSDSAGNCSFYCQVKTDSLINAPGLTITFYKPLNQFATDFDIITINGMTEVKRIAVRGNQRATFETNQEITGCNKIRLEIKKWSKGNYYPKITQIDFGLFSLFNPDNLTAARVQNKASAISESLPLSTLVFKFINDGTYDPIFETGRNKFVQDRQPVTLKIGNPKEQIENMYYELTGRPEVTLNEVEIKATSLLVKFEKEQPTKWKQNVSLYSIAEEIMTECNVKKYKIDASLKNISVTCLISENYRGTLTDLLIASQCVIVQRLETLCIEKRSFAPTGYKIKKDVSAFPEISIQDDIKKIIIYQKNYSLEPQETVTTFTAPSAGKHTISIRSATDISVSGGTLLQAGVDFVKVNAANGATVTVTGKPIIETETKHEFGTGTTAKEVKKNPFIVRPSDVANWLLAYYARRQEISVEWRQDNAIELLDVLAVESDYGDIDIIVEEQSFDFDGGFKGETKGRAVYGI